MGPTLIFDKSLLQSISVDESVFLQQFFITNMTPLFYVETLADLDLVKHKSGKPITKVISELAIKVPSMSIAPSIHHSRLVAGNLYGIDVEMDGRIIREGGVEKIDSEGKVGIHFSESKEEVALRRWHKQEYFEIERLFSKTWRNALSNFTFDSVLAIIKNIIPKDVKLSKPSDVISFVEDFIQNTNGELLLYLVTELVGFPQVVYRKALNRWDKGHFSNFADFAPYAAFILKIDLFFYICIYKGIESKDRPSHKIDLAYLYYLPFCNIFVSSDKLHKRITPFFLRNNQVFIDGSTFKEGLQKLDTYYSQYKDKIKEVGFLGFTSQPPKDFENAISNIWDKTFPNWRKTKSQSFRKRNPKEEKKLIEHLRKVQKESKIVSRKTPMDQVHHMSMTYKSPVQKGKWRILPKGIEKEKANNQKSS